MYLTNSRNRNGVVFGAVLFMILLSCKTGGGRLDENRPMSLSELYRFCDIPSSCDNSPNWDGKTVLFQGYVDKGNVFENKRYPQLPYEKFSVIDGFGKSIEVWVKASDSRPFFSKIYKKMNTPIIINGRLAVAKMSSMEKCMLTAKVWIDDLSQIQ